MKAVRLYAKGDLRVEDVPAPAVLPGGWVRVRVVMAGICGSDLHNFKTGQWISRSPSTAGHEFTGVVTELGEGVRGFCIGDVVVADSRFWCGECVRCQGGEQHLCERLGFVGEVCDGGFAEETILPERLLHLAPDGLAPQIAAMAEPFAVALHAVRRLRLGTDEPLLIVGCGPIGGLSAVVAKRLGFGPIYVADRNADRASLVARATGAKVVAVEDARCRAVIDATGSVAALRQLLACVLGGGRIALVGISHGTLEIDPNVLVEREISLIGCHAFQHELPEAIAMLPDCAEMMMQLVDGEISLDEVPEAYRRIAAGACQGLKVLVRC
jgi:(R,R)-butanediol dehydrogenase / meso-butanediol dehydrogenase / diacetyl reductase